MSELNMTRVSFFYCDFGHLYRLQVSCYDFKIYSTYIISSYSSIAVHLNSFYLFCIGNFSFGSCTKFKSHTIVDFIENAVEHSRSGRYLFFLHRRPVLGPMRVQLLHPVSRFKQVQSLQHTCRFVILKMVRKDLIPTLPLPRRLIDYLSAPHYYSEQLACEQEERVESPVSSSTGELEKICFTPQGLS